MAGGEIGASEPGQALRKRLGEQLADGFQQQGKVKRLLHQRIDTASHGSSVLMRACGDDDERQERPASFDPLQGPPAIQPGHVDVEQRQVGQFTA